VIRGGGLERRISEIFSCCFWHSLEFDDDQFA
jgi:hypothetical protein